MVSNDSLVTSCFYYKDGYCYYLDKEKCIGLCPQWISFKPSIRNMVNKKLDKKYRVNDTDPVDKWRLDKAFGYNITSRVTVQKPLSD